MTTEAVRRAARVKWYTEARFGLSLHYGLYSLIGRGEWVRSIEQMEEGEYMRYFNEFSPKEGCAREWARAAREAGARYVVLTAKHHDGFCLFDSALTDYKSTNTPAKRDIVGEYVEAVRGEGLRVGLYYSLVDWHHPDYPAYGDRQHPLRHKAEARERDKGCVWERYVEYMHGQVRELCTQYGRIDVLVFDFSYWEYYGEKWRATELMRLIRELQPEVVVNDRLGREAIKEVERPGYAGDYDQAEMDIPREQVRNKGGEVIPWESWFPISNSWAYNPSDQEYKEAGTIIRALVNCVSKGGNLLLNVAPGPWGELDGRTWATLREIGEWLGVNGESVYGCGPAALGKPEWGRWTQKGGYLYAHIMEPVIGHISLEGLRGKVKSAYVLATRRPAILCDYWNPGIQTFDGPSDIFLNFGRPVQYTWALPDGRDTVVRLEYTTEEECARLLEEYREEFARATARVPFP
ncbi:MAG: alpha-L-fucosidase [bacterium]|nr:alpha-L-fucosidase [bacterium]